MSIQRLHVASRYSEAVIHHGVIHLAGQLADDLSGDIRQQTRETLAAIDRRLAEAGSDKTRILSATIYLRDIDADFAGMNAEWDAWVAPGAAPARATVQARLYAPAVRGEIQIVAAQAE